MSFKRGTLVTFVGPLDDEPHYACYAYGGMFLSKKYGVSIGNKGKVVRIKGGWRMVTWTRSDGSSAVSVPMRPSWLKEGHEVIEPASEIKQQAEEDEKKPKVCWLDKSKETRNGTTYNLNNTCVHTESDRFEEQIKKGWEFVPYGAAPYKGARTGYTFKQGEFGTGYYLNTCEVLLAKLRAAEDTITESSETILLWQTSIGPMKEAEADRKMQEAERKMQEAETKMREAETKVRPVSEDEMFKVVKSVKSGAKRKKRRGEKECLVNEEDAKFCTWTDTVAAWGHVMGRRAGRRGLWVQA